MAPKIEVLLVRWDGILDCKRGWFPSNFVSPPQKSKCVPERQYGWVRRKSKDARQLYYNTLTGETLYYEPHVDEREAADNGDVLNVISQYRERSDRQQAGIPRAVPIEQKPELDDSQHEENRSNLTRPPSPSSGLPLHWGMKKTIDNRAYYYNMLTNETTWDIEDIDRETGKLKIKSAIGTAPASPEELNERIREVSPGTSWETVRKNIQSKINLLKQSAKRGEKNKFLAETSALVQTIQQMMELSGALGNEVYAIKSNKMLQIHHRHIMKSLSKLVMSSKKAAGVWPPPDATARLISEANEVMLSVRHFTTTAEECGIPLKLQEVELPAQMPKPIKLSVSDFLDGLEHIPPAINAATMDIKSFFEERNNNQGELIQLTRFCVNEVGQLLALLEEMDLSGISADIVNEFEIHKKDLYSAISSLVNATTAAVDRLAPEDAFDHVIECTILVDTATNDLVIAAKFVLEQHQLIDEKLMQNDMAEYEKAGVDLVPRRALSVNVSFKNKSETPQSKAANNEAISSTGESVPLSSTATDLPALARSSPPSPAVSDGVPKSIMENAFLNKSSPLTRAKQAKTVSTSAPHRRPTLGTGSKLSKFFGEDVSEELAAAKEDPWFLQDQEKPEDILMSMEGTLKGATLQTLINKLTHHSDFDANLTQTFLMTFHSFATSREVLTLLAKRFNLAVPEGLSNAEADLFLEKKQKPIRLRVLNILKSWLDTFFGQIKDQQTLDLIESFAQKTIHPLMPSAAEQLMRLIERLRSGEAPVSKKLVNNREPPAPILPRSLKRIKLSDLDPLELARQLTILESNSYNAIQPHECLSKAWSDKGSSTKSPNIKAMILLTNQITGWVAETILLERDIKRRATLMKYFISVGEKCRSLNNFNALMAILASLNSSPIHRLKRTRELLSAKARSTLDELKLLMQPAQNFINYRTELRSVNLPCVPFLGLYLTDLTFIEDGNSDVVKSMPHLINIDKRIKTADKIREIQQYQYPYGLMEVPELQNFIRHNLRNGERDPDELYQKSLQLEPREREDEKIARLLQESGFL